MVFCTWLSLILILSFGRRSCLHRTRSEVLGSVSFRKHTKAALSQVLPLITEECSGMRLQGFREDLLSSTHWADATLVEKRLRPSAWATTPP